LEYFEDNFTADWLKVYARVDPNMGDLVQREHPQNWGLSTLILGVFPLHQIAHVGNPSINPNLLWVVS